MKKELKQKIKQDDFVSGVGQVWGWGQTHRDEVRITAAVLLLVAVGAGAFAYFQGARDREAAEAFAAALDAFHGPVASELPEGFEKPAGPVFDSAVEKNTKAAAAFDGIERKYGSLAMGVRARYYGALCRIELGKTQEAQKALDEVAARKDLPLESALARMALADLLRREGQVDKAIEAYQRLADEAGLALPREHALMSLAGTFEEAHRMSEARAAYGRLAQEFPGSAYAQEAGRRAQYLDPEAKG